MTFKYTKIHATILALGTAGLFQVTPAFAQVQTSEPLQFCSQMAVFGPSKPTNCLNNEGQYVDKNGNIGNIPTVNDSTPTLISNTTGLKVPGCNTIAVFGPGKPTDCINDNGQYIDSQGNVSNQGSDVVTTSVNTKPLQVQNCDSKAVFGPSKPTDCMNSSGQYVDHNGNVGPDGAVTTGVYETRPVQIPSCSSMAVFGPSKPTNCMNDAGQYVSDELDVTPEESPMQCGGNITTKCYTNDDGYIDANGKRFDLNSKIGMTESYSILACENVVDNIMFKGQADYLPLWDPPQHTISDITFTMEPRFSPTDLIFNNVNYGKGAVLLSNSTKTNPRTGATISLDNQPVIMNNCNIKWVVPAWVYEELERRARAARESDGGAVFGPGNGNSAPRILLGIDAEGYRIGMDGQRLESQESESLRSYYVERLEKNSESGFGMYWEDMEWNPDAGLWLPTGGERNVTDRDYMY